MSNLLDKYTKPTGRTILDAPESAESEEIDDLGCFGWLRGSKERAVSLELRKKDGRIQAIPYGWIERFEFDPTEGITLVVAGAKIRITGRQLNGQTQSQISLFNGLARHRVPWVREASGAEALDAGKCATIVERLLW